MPIDLRDPASVHTASRGRCFLYVAPCAGEDLLKIGFSRDPLQRLQSLHRRWFEFFDLDRIALAELDTVREARALELSLKRLLADRNTNAPLTVERAAAGLGEWYRGAGDELARFFDELPARGHRVHVPAGSWLRAALEARTDLLYAWTDAALTVDELELRAGPTPAQRVVRDALDACAALGIDFAERVPETVLRWYRAGGGLR